jgi:penicillinase repressor
LFAVGLQLHTLLGFNIPAQPFRPLQKKVKVEVTDEEGTIYSLAVRGKFSHDKVIRVMELIDLIGQTDRNMATANPPDESTTYGRILKLIQSSYRTKEFSSADIAKDYEDQHTSPIPLSTVSTYLSRLADRGVLSRQKFGNSWVYHIIHVPSNQLAT